MNAMAPCPPNSPLMKAWEAHKATEEYANSHSWAIRYIPPDDPAEIDRIRESGANPWTREMKISAAEGSLWAMFEAGWKAAGGADPFGEVTIVNPDGSFTGPKPLTFRENLGGEYGVGE